MPNLCYNWVMENIVGRLKSLIPYDQFQLILGSLLGDARLECRSKSVRAKHTARLRVHQSEKQKGYVFWKYAKLKNMVSKGPRFTKVWHDRKRNKIHFSWYFHTRSDEILGLFHKLFYKKGIKILPSKILNSLEPLGLAVWYMDDGSNNGDDITLNTHNFSVSEQKILQKLLLTKFGVRSTLVKDRSKYKMAIGRYEYEKFVKVVKPYVIRSMNYKISGPRNDLPQMRQAAIL